jgi:hypothetical protein
VQAFKWPTGVCKAAVLVFSVSLSTPQFAGKLKDRNAYKWYVEN